MNKWSELKCDIEDILTSNREDEAIVMIELMEETLGAGEEIKTEFYRFEQQINHYYEALKSMLKQEPWRVWMRVKLSSVDLLSYTVRRYTPNYSALLSKAISELESDFGAGSSIYPEFGQYENQIVELYDQLKALEVEAEVEAEVPAEVPAEVEVPVAEVPVAEVLTVTLNASAPMPTLSAAVQVILQPKGWRKLSFEDKVTQLQNAISVLEVQSEVREVFDIIQGVASKKLKNLFAAQRRKTKRLNAEGSLVEVPVAPEVEVPVAPEVEVPAEVPAEVLVARLWLGKGFAKFGPRPNKINLPYMTRLKHIEAKLVTVEEIEGEALKYFNEYKTELSLHADPFKSGFALDLGKFTPLDIQNYNTHNHYEKAEVNNLLGTFLIAQHMLGYFLNMYGIENQSLFERFKYALPEVVRIAEDLKDKCARMMIDPRDVPYEVAFVIAAHKVKSFIPEDVHPVLSKMKDKQVQEGLKRAL